MQALLEQYLPELSARQQEQFCRYYDMLLDWNARVNLTAITEPAEVVQKHFVDSLGALPYLPQVANCVDVGTGAGFPGIPLCIVRTDLSMTLVDSLGKRVKFLEAVCQALDIPARCVHSRAEDLGRAPEHRERYRIALSRAVAPLNVLLELTTPLIQTGGSAIAYKGPAVEEEAAACGRACQALHCTLNVYALAAAYGQRRLAIATKTGPTPKPYPRRAGEPGRKPL